MPDSLGIYTADNIGAMRAARGSSPEDPLPVFDAMTAEPEDPPACDVLGFLTIAPQTLTIITGSPNVGKSFLALAGARSVDAAVGMVDGEMTASRVRQRAEMLDWPQGRFLRYLSAGQWRSRKEDMQARIDWASPLDLVIIDSATKCDAGYDDDSWGDFLLNWVSPMFAAGCGVWLIDHPPKGRGDTNFNSSRGSGRKKQDCDFMLQVTGRLKPLPDRPGVLTVNNWKDRFGAYPCEEGEPVSRITVTSAGGRWVFDAAPVTDEDDEPRPSRSVTAVAEWIIEHPGCNQRSLIDGTGLNKRTVAGAATVLEDAGSIEVDRSEPHRGIRYWPAGSMLL